MSVMFVRLAKHDYFCKYFIVMKRIFPFSIITLMTILTVTILSSCGDKAASAGPACRIHGVMESSDWDGKRIFLVPFEGVRDSTTVDSTVINNGKFEFISDSAEMKIIRLDYHFRRGTQDLLVITEPGDVDVFIGQVSHGGGTPQNDSLQVWKDGLAKFNEEYARLKKENKSLLKTEGKEIQKRTRAFSRDMAKRMPEGIFKSYLNKYYPDSNANK